MQSHVIRLPTGAQQHSILLLLNRFHVDRYYRGCSDWPLVSGIKWGSWGKAALLYELHYFIFLIMKIHHTHREYLKTVQNKEEKST